MLQPPQLDALLSKVVAQSATSPADVLTISGQTANGTTF